MTTILDLGPAAEQVKTLVAGVTDDQLSAPTPCEGTPVAAMLDHFVGLTAAFRDAAMKSIPPGGSPQPAASASHLDPDWRRLLPQQLDDLVAAWKEPAAWEGMTEAGGVTMPAAVMGKVAVDELVPARLGPGSRDRPAVRVRSGEHAGGLRVHVGDVRAQRSSGARRSVRARRGRPGGRAVARPCARLQWPRSRVEASHRSMKRCPSSAISARSKGRDRPTTVW